VEQGSDAVAIFALCKRLGVTNGSFHHHFTTVPGFISTLRRGLGGRVAHPAGDRGDRAEPLRLLELQINAGLPPATEVEADRMARRRSNPVIGAARQRVRPRRP
jgi:hypothetical protein